MKWHLESARIVPTPESRSECALLGWRRLATRESNGGDAPAHWNSLARQRRRRGAPSPHGARRVPEMTLSPVGKDDSPRGFAGRCPGGPIAARGHGVRIADGRRKKLPESGSGDRPARLGARHAPRPVAIRQAPSGVASSRGRLPSGSGAEHRDARCARRPGARVSALSPVGRRRPGPSGSTRRPTARRTRGPEGHPSTPPWGHGIATKSEYEGGNRAGNGRAQEQRAVPMAQEDDPPPCCLDYRSPIGWTGGHLLTRTTRRR
jgi:hypothetical protein